MLLTCDWEGFRFDVEVAVRSPPGSLPLSWRPVVVFCEASRGSRLASRYAELTQERQERLGRASCCACRLASSCPRRRFTRGALASPRSPGPLREFTTCACTLGRPASSQAPARRSVPDATTHEPSRHLFNSAGRKDVGDDHAVAMDFKELEPVDLLAGTRLVAFVRCGSRRTPSAG